VAITDPRGRRPAAGPGPEGRTPRVAYLLTQDRGGPVDLTVQLAAAVTASGAAQVRLFGPQPARGAAGAADLLEPVPVHTKSDVRGMARLREAVLGWRPDVLHAQDRRAGLVAAALRRLPGAPPVVVHTYHGVPDDVGEPWFRGTSGAPGPSRYTRLVLAADALVARSIHRTIAPAPSMEAFLRRRLRVPQTRLVHIDNGVALPEPAPPSPGPIRDLLFVGLLVERKGVADLLDALGRPGVAPTDLRLQIAGDGPERATLEELADRGPLRGRVRFLGFREDVPSLLARCDALVLPSRMEQQPLVVAEAMAAGKPVVATDTGGVADMLSVAGVERFLAAPGDPASLAAQLQRLFRHPAPARVGRALATSARSRFAIDVSAAAHLALYTELAAAARRR
jgi:glycosyltransferase involved in cell wall biosynthesis